MAGSSVIGALRVNLGLDSAQFMQGVKASEDRMRAFGSRMQDFGDKAARMGRNLSVVSAGMAAVAGAGFLLVKNTAEAGAEIDRQAKISNASTDEFQRWSAAAKTVGIEQDKMSDILKDVNDRVGDFLQTGGGPMADFFENIAPKVGVTAEMFRDLSGPEALQLYVSSLEKAGISQQEMTFYLEAMASDATVLLPLLANNGAELNRLADAAQNAGGVMSAEAIAASIEFREKLAVLQTSLSGLVTTIGVALIPVITKLVDAIQTHVVPVLISLAGKVSEVIGWFEGLSAPVQAAAGAIATAFGVGGPVLLAVGTAARVIGGLVAAAGPIGLFITAATLAVTAWQIWGDDIKALFAVVVEWVTTKFNELVAYFEALPERFLQFGRDLIQGLTNGITEKWEELKSTVTGAADSVANWFKEAVGINSPSRVFHQFGEWLMEGLQLGIGAGQPGVEGAMKGLVQAVNGNGVSLAGSMQSFGDVASTVLKDVTSRSKTLSQSLKEVASSWLSSMARNFMDSAMNSLFGGFKLPGFANGTQNFGGGFARINERGGEIVKLPSGSQVIPHDISKRMADGTGGSVGGTVMIGFDQSTGSLTAYFRNVAGEVVSQASSSIVSQSVQATKAAQARGYR